MGKPTGFLEFSRKMNGTVEPLERIKFFEEFHPPLNLKERQQQAARAVLPFKNRNAVAPVVQLIRNRQAGGAGAYHSHPLAAADGGNSGRNPALPEALLNDGQLVVVNRYGLPLHPAGAGGFAQGRAHPSRKLREIAGFQEPVQGLSPVAVVDFVIPLGD